MRDFMLLAAMLAFFGFSWFLMRRLDGYLNGVRLKQTDLPETKGDMLKVGLSDLLAADSIAPALEQYSQECPDTPARLFSGPSEELLRGLSSHQLHVAIVSDAVDVPQGVVYLVRRAFVTDAPVVMKDSGLSIEPVVCGHTAQIVMLRTGEDAYAERFIRCLGEFFSIRDPQK